jgi:hypothetical protein
METTGILATVLAVWGIIFTVNSAASAFLQTKWMYDQRKLIREIRDLVRKLVGDDIRKSDLPCCSQCMTCGEDDCSGHAEET